MSALSKPGRCFLVWPHSWSWWNWKQTAAMWRSWSKITRVYQQQHLTEVVSMCSMWETGVTCSSMVMDSRKQIDDSWRLQHVNQHALLDSDHSCFHHTFIMDLYWISVCVEGELEVTHPASVLHLFSFDTLKTELMIHLKFQPSVLFIWWQSDDLWLKRKT